MIAELERVIRDEEAKPLSERDTDLIDECVREIAELKGVRAEFSDEEVTAITGGLIDMAKQGQKRKRFIRLAAGIAAVFVIGTGITACTFNSTLLNWLETIVRLPFGSVSAEDKVTYIHQSATEEYNSVGELLLKKGIDIYYSKALPAGISTKYVEVVESDNGEIISFQFTPDTFHYAVQLSYSNPEIFDDIITVVEKDDICFSVYAENEHYIACSVIDEDTYIIQANSINDIILFVGGLRKD